MNCFGKYAKAGTAVFALLKRHPKWGSLPKAGIANASHCLPRLCSLPKAFQTNASRLIGFVATLGTSLEEFAEDVRSILDAKIKNL